MSVFNPYKVRREKQTSRTFQLENDEDIDQFSSVAQFKNHIFLRKALAVT